MLPLANGRKIAYSRYILTHTRTSNFSTNNQRDIILDIAANLKQIGTWTRQGFARQKEQIALYLKLTRKDLNALLGFPAIEALDPHIQSFNSTFGKLEKEFDSGIANHQDWADWMFKLGDKLRHSATLL